jgi:flagellar motor switch protein FliN/FliY
MANKLLRTIEEMEHLFSQTLPAVPQDSAGAMAAGQGHSGDQDLDRLLTEAAAVVQPGTPAAEAVAYRLEEFSGDAGAAATATVDLPRDVSLDLEIELGRTHMCLDEVLKLRKGSVVPLDKRTEEPVDLYVNGRLIARGEVVVLGENFCVRVTELCAEAGAFS